VIGCCGHVTTAQTRDLFMFTLATIALSAAACKQQYVANYTDLQTPIGDKAGVISAVYHFHIIADKLMNETK